MNKNQFAELIGEIDDRIIQQAGEAELKSAPARRKKINRLISIAVAIMLMICSFGAGAFAFDQKEIVEVPVEQEIIKLDEIGMTLILPESWEGKYALEKNESENEYHVYNPEIRKAMGGEDTALLSGGMLFYVSRWDQQLTKEQVEAGGEWDFARCEHIMTTGDGTYLLYYASDVQCTMDTLDEYNAMVAEIKDIRFEVRPL